MQILINIKGHGQVPDAEVPEILARVEALKAAAAAAGLVLRADTIPANPNPGIEAVPAAVPAAPASSEPGGVDHA